MANKSLLWLLPAAAVLGMLVWLDNRKDEGEEGPGTTVSASGTKPPANVEPAAKLAPSEDRHSVPPTDPALGSNPLATLDINRLSDTIKRPLFAPTRRPPRMVRAPAPVIKKKKKPKPAAYKLLGVAKSGNRTVALLGRESDGRSFLVEKGDTLSGWSVAQITKDSILLERGDGSNTTVYLFRQPTTHR